MQEIRLVRHRSNRGYGAALKTGIRQARGEVIVITDADGTYPPEYILQLLEALEDCEMAVGARTGEAVKVPLLRKPAKWFLKKLGSFLAQRNIPDLNSGLRAFRKRDVMPLFGILPSGFSFTTSITLAMLCNDMRVEYIPIDYHKREGRSKIRPLPDTAKFLLLVLRTICLFNPLRVFVPLAAALLVSGLIRLGWNVIVSRNIAELEVMLILGGIQIGAFGLLADMVARLRRLPGRG
jgi:glycosyltransferase involved in cell wall biosynthesis